MSLFRRKPPLRNCPSCGKSLTPGWERPASCDACLKAAATQELARQEQRRKSCYVCGRPTGSSYRICSACYANTGVQTFAAQGLTVGRLSASAARKMFDLPDPPPLPPLPEVQQDELLKGTKYATLWLRPDGEPEFGGVGYTGGRYSTEGFAKCMKKSHHSAPQPDCTCGFWIAVHPQSKLSYWEANTVALEVEFGGRVVDCGKDPLPAEPWGYRAQWQRVLSVSLSPRCSALSAEKLSSAYPPYTWGSLSRSTYRYHGTEPCPRIPGFLAADSGGRLHSVCESHVVGLQALSKPVSWLRERLQTEVRPGTVTDDAPPPTMGGAEPRHGRQAWSITAADPTFLPAISQLMPYPMWATNIQWEWHTDPGTKLTTYTCSWDEY